MKEVREMEGKDWFAKFRLNRYLTGQWQSVWNDRWMSVWPNPLANDPFTACWLVANFFLRTCQERKKVIIWLLLDDYFEIIFASGPFSSTLTGWIMPRGKFFTFALHLLVRRIRTTSLYSAFCFMLTGFAD